MRKRTSALVRVGGTLCRLGLDVAGFALRQGGKLVDPALIAGQRMAEEAVLAIVLCHHKHQRRK